MALYAIIFFPMCKTPRLVLPQCFLLLLFLSPRQWVAMIPQRVLSRSHTTILREASLLTTEMPTGPETTSCVLSISTTQKHSSGSFLKLRLHGLATWLGTKRASRPTHSVLGSKKYLGLP